MGGCARARDLLILGGVADVAQVGEERDAARDRVFAGDVDVEAFGAPVGGAGLDARAACDEAAPLASGTVRRYPL